MIKKIQGYFNVVLLLFVIFGIGYFVFNIIKDKITVPDRLTSENITIYLNSDNLVRSNQVYQNLDKCLANFIEACVNEEYDELYDVMLENYKKIYSKSESKNIFEKYKNIFSTVDVNEEYTEFEGNLSYAYNYKNDGYILVSKTKNYTKFYLYVIYDDYLGTYNYAIVDM